MEIKPKKCKGTGKAAGYGCGKLVKNRKYGLGINCCYAGWLYSNDGHETLMKSIIKSKTKVAKEEKVKTRKAKIENKSIAVLILEARAPFQRLIRIRDHRKQCICCFKMLPYDLGGYDAGHYFKAETNRGLIFHPDNVHGQSKYCNNYLHGNESGYNSGLITRIGILSYNELVKLKDKLKNHKWDRYKLIEMKKHYQSELNKVEKNIIDISEVDFSIGIIE